MIKFAAILLLACKSYALNHFYENQNTLFFIHYFIYSSVAGCNDSKQTNTEAKENQPQSDKQASLNNNIDLQAPELADPAIRQYYNSYTTYLKKVVTAIRNKDEAGTMKLFTEEGKQFDNMNEMEIKARSTPEEEQKFTTWLMQAYTYQKEVIQSDYYKKFTQK